MPVATPESRFRARGRRRVRVGPIRMLTLATRVCCREPEDGVEARPLGSAAHPGCRGQYCELGKPELRYTHGRDRNSGITSEALPIENDPDAIARTLWRLTYEEYRKASSPEHQREDEERGARERRRRSPDFSVEKPSSYIDNEQPAALPDHRSAPKAVSAPPAAATIPGSIGWYNRPARLWACHPGAAAVPHPCGGRSRLRRTLPAPPVTLPTALG